MKGVGLNEGVMAHGDSSLFLLSFLFLVSFLFKFLF
jgi:hypothetical protein